MYGDRDRNEAAVARSPAACPKGEMSGGASITPVSRDHDTLCTELLQLPNLSRRYN